MLPWADLLRFASWRLSWTPADFWSATPRELEAVLGLHRPAGALTRCDFDRLRHAYPDGPARPRGTTQSQGVVP